MKLVMSSERGWSMMDGEARVGEVQVSELKSKGRLLKTHRFSWASWYRS